MTTSKNPHPTIVVGAGLSGLAASIHLARAGHEVALVEAGEAHGGCCSTTCVDGFQFNNGALYVAVPSLLRTVFESLGLDLDAEVPMAAITLPMETHLDDGGIVRLSDTTTSYATGPLGVERTRILREGLSRMRTDWEPVYHALVRQVIPHGPSPWNAIVRLGRHLPKLRGNAATLIKRYFPDSGVQAAIGSLLLYTGLPPERLPAMQIIGLLALLEEGFHLPQGGMGAISDALLRHAQASGVTVHLKQRVERIEVTKGKAAGVLLSSGEHLAASTIVSTVSGFALSQYLLPADEVPRKLKRTARRATLSHRAISIQIGASVPVGEGAFIVNHVPSLDRQALMHQVPDGRPRWLSYTVPSRILSRIAPPGKSVVECFAPAQVATTAAEWPSQRTDAIVEQYMESLSARIPSLSVETMRVMDPANFENSRNLHEGALYGITPGAPPHHLFPHRSGIKGLYLAGQTTFPGYGVATAAVSGVQAAQALLNDSRTGARH